MKKVQVTEAWKKSQHWDAQRGGVDGHMRVISEQFEEKRQVYDSVMNREGGKSPTPKWLK
jgi:hypothetical protein